KVARLSSASHAALELFLLSGIHTECRRCRRFGGYHTDRLRAHDHDHRPGFGSSDFPSSYRCITPDHCQCNSQLSISIDTPFREFGVPVADVPSHLTIIITVMDRNNGSNAQGSSCTVRT
ncbi:hypothetical protein BJV78DRAFT_1197946, partial [Lactifluus subvellereus]